MNTDSDRKLHFKEFKSATKKDWKEKATADLKGASISSLNWHPFEENENILVEPYYTQEDVHDLDYLRDFHESRKNELGWKSFIRLTDI